MNAKLNNEIAGHIAKHEWQELLRKLPPNEEVPLAFATIGDMDNLRSVAARLNSKGLDENRYSFRKLNYQLKCIIALATPKNDKENNDPRAE